MITLIAADFQWGWFLRVEDLGVEGDAAETILPLIKWLRWLPLIFVFTYHVDFGAG